MPGKRPMSSPQQGELTSLGGKSESILRKVKMPRVLISCRVNQSRASSQGFPMQSRNTERWVVAREVAAANRAASDSNWQQYRAKFRGATGHQHDRFKSYSPLARNAWIDQAVPEILHRPQKHTLSSSSIELALVIMFNRDAAASSPRQSRPFFSELAISSFLARSRSRP